MTCLTLNHQLFYWAIGVAPLLAGRFLKPPVTVQPGKWGKYRQWPRASEHRLYQMDGSAGRW